MRLPTDRIWRFCVIVMGLFGLSRTAASQTAAVHLVEERAGGYVFEVRTAWPRSLAAAVDSAGGGPLTDVLAVAVSSRFLDASETFSLPALVQPRVRVLSSDFEEVTLPTAEGADSLVAFLNRPAVEVVGLGLERRRPAATLSAHLLTYDEARRTLRRYRRLLVEVDFGRVSAAEPRTAAGPALQRTSNPHAEVTRSVLADGYVFKIPITAEGVYRIDRTLLARLLSGTGVSPDAVRAEHLKVYGNGGAPLPALNGAPRPADLIENPVYARDTGAGVELFFYARAPTGWRFDAGQDQWVHYINPFSNENFYFLKVDLEGAAPRRVGEPAFPAFPDAQPVSQVTGRIFLDLDEELWSKDRPSGYTWVSRQIRSSGRLDLFSNTVPPGLAAGTVTYRARAAIRSNPAAAVYFSSNGTVLAEAVAGLVSSHQTAPIARVAEATFSHPVSAGAGLNLTMTLQERTGDPQAALDWVRVFYPQDLRAENGYLHFATPAGAAGRLEVSLRGFTQEPHVWDVTEPGSIRRLGVQRQGDAYAAQLEVAVAQPREIVAFTEAALREVDAEGVRPVERQNLHGIQSYPDFIIVAPDTFRAQAEALAEHRRQEGLVVEVAGVQQIYNEFSGGLQDMRAVRDYFKFLYDRALDEARLLRYALLFGDGHHNFRDLGPNQPTLHNWILPYQTEESLDPDASFTSDDYFGLLDDEEGLWPYVSYTYVSQERMDIGVGRFPVQSVREAEVLVEKIKQYETAATFGPWRTRYTFVADDGFNGLNAVNEDADLHVQNADVVADDVQAVYPALNVKKIYGPSYPRVFLNIWRQPEARRDVLAAIDNGTLVLNYSGHGGENGLTQEEIFTKEDAASLENEGRLPIFITATCSFGRWDMATEQSGAEVLLLNDRGGSIALMTTVRTVYTSRSTTSLNVGLNRALNAALFEPDERGLPRRLGDAMRVTKNTRAGLESNNRKFNLLGDPTLRIGLPARSVVVKTVNGVPVTEAQAPLRALDRVTIAGEVHGVAGGLDAGFNGPVSLTVFDAERQVPLPYHAAMPVPYYMVREDLIWRGEINATGGQFEATFVVPKDISYSNRPGRISAYAQAGEGHAIGYTENVVVGGSSAEPPDDSEGPEITLFLNDTTFVSGGLTHGKPSLIVRLHDHSGINTVGAGVGHEMLLVVDGDERSAVNISGHYESEENSYQRGRVLYPLEEYLRQQQLDAFSPGPHTLRVKAWDVLNNSNEATIDFYVAQQEALVLRNVYNYPNPTSGQTQFLFEHNQLRGTPAEVQVRIYTVAGRPVRTIETEEALPEGMLPGMLVRIPWDGLDEDRDPLATGIYLYKVRVMVDQPEGERQVAEHVERLAIIR